MIGVHVEAYKVHKSHYDKHYYKMIDTVRYYITYSDEAYPLL